MESVRILLYSLIFLVSVFGNLLIIVVLMVNKRMRTVTNSFLLSLAVSDLMMAIFCMPFTLIPTLLKDFIFGAAMCKIVSYLMGKTIAFQPWQALFCNHTHTSQRISFWMSLISVPWWSLGKGILVVFGVASCLRLKHILY